MKAFLVENNVPFPKTHALTKFLLPLCSEIDADFENLKPFLLILDPYSVHFRYPGEEIAAQEARTAFDAAKKIRRFILGKLDISNQRKLL